MNANLPKTGRNFYGAFSIYLLVYVAVKIIFIFSGHDLFTEEAQYWLWSQHLDWSYYSKPPLIAWINYLTGIFIHSDYAIRFSALLFGLGTLFVFYHLALLLFNNYRVARMSVVILSVSPYFVIASTFFTTDTLLIFFWASCLYFIIRAYTDSSRQNWIFAGIAFGLGCLSKYAMFFFLFTLIVLVFLDKESKQGKGILLFLVIGIALFMPVIIWNYQLGWVSLKHLSGLAGANQQLYSWKHSLQNISEFLGGMILVNSPFILFFLFRKSFRKVYSQNSTIRDKKLLLLLIFPFIGTAGIFFFISIFKRTEVNWASMSYLSIPIIIAYGVELTRTYRKAFISVALTIIFLLFFLFPVLIDYSGMNSFIPTKTDGFKRMAGWKELSQKIKDIRDIYPDFGPILTDSYHVASEISFYTLFQDIYCLNNGRRMNQFDVWGGLEDLAHNPVNAIYVTEADYIDASLIYESTEAHYSIPIYYRGETIKVFHIYIIPNLLLNPNLHFTEF